MKHAACVIAFVAAVASAIPAWAVEQSPKLEEGHLHPAQAVGVSLLAAAANLIYFPARLALTIATAEAGGIAGWMTGGDQRSAGALWDATEGQAFLTPAILEGRERLRFGP